MAERAPFFYRSPNQIADMLHAGFFRTAFREALCRLPTSSHFRDSHFGEMLSAMFAVEVMHWKLIYSKLKLLTAENSNAFKMDLVFFDPNQVQPTFVLGEVKSSMKSTQPANHDRSCYPALFDSLRKYTDADLRYDLTAARDNVEALSETDRQTVRAALLPYADRRIVYAGFSVIDSKTRNCSETSMLATRSSPKIFDVDLICVEEISAVSMSTFTMLDNMRHV